MDLTSLGLVKNMFWKRGFSWDLEGFGRKIEVWAIAWSMITWCRPQPEPRPWVWSHNSGCPLVSKVSVILSLGSGQSEPPRLTGGFLSARLHGRTGLGFVVCMGEWQTSVPCWMLWYQDGHLSGWGSSPEASAIAGSEAPYSLFKSVPWVDSLRQPPGPSYLSTSRSSSRAELRPRPPPQRPSAGHPSSHFGELLYRGCQEHPLHGIVVPVCAFWGHLASPTFFSSDSFWKIRAFLLIALIRILKHSPFH